MRGQERGRLLFAADDSEVVFDGPEGEVETFGHFFGGEAGGAEGADFLAQKVAFGGGIFAAEDGGEGAAGLVAVAADLVEAVDHLHVAEEGGGVGVELFGDLFVGEAGEHQVLDEETALGGAFDLIERRGGFGAEFGDEGVAVGDVFLAAENPDVIVEGPYGHVKLAGDAAVGPAFEEAVENRFAARSGAVELADAAALAVFAGMVPGGRGDFVAKKQAGGEVGDEDVPTVTIGAGIEADAVAFVAGKGGEWFGDQVELAVGAERGESFVDIAEAGAEGFETGFMKKLIGVVKITLTPTLSRCTGRGGKRGRGQCRLGDFALQPGGKWRESGLEVDPVAEGADGDGEVDGADEFFAAGADPAVAGELAFVFVEVVVGSNESGMSARPTGALSPQMLGEHGHSGDGLLEFFGE